MNYLKSLFDVDALRNKLKSLQHSAQAQEHVWRPKPGKHLIRIIDYKHNETGIPFIKMYMHYQLNGKTWTSPKSYGLPDPLEEASIKMRMGDRLPRDEYRFVMNLLPTLRTYIPVIVRGEESEGVQFWGVGKKVSDFLMPLLCDDDWSGITDLISGNDIAITIIPPPTEQEFVQTVCQPRKTSTPLVIKGDEHYKTVMDSITNMIKIEDVFPAAGYEELTEQLELFLRTSPQANGDEEESEEKENTEKEVTEKVVKSSVSATSASEVEEEFKGLFEEEGEEGDDLPF